MEDIGQYNHNDTTRTCSPGFQALRQKWQRYWREGWPKWTAAQDSQSGEGVPRWWPPALEPLPIQDDHSHAGRSVIWPFPRRPTPRMPSLKNGLMPLTDKEATSASEDTEDVAECLLGRGGRPCGVDGDTCWFTRNESGGKYETGGQNDDFPLHDSSPQRFLRHSLWRRHTWTAGFCRVFGVETLVRDPGLAAAPTGPSKEAFKLSCSTVTPIQRGMSLL